MDISDEISRIYTFPGGDEVVVEGGLLLKVTRDENTGMDSHRIITSLGTGVYIARGWIAIEWKNKPGLAPMRF